MSQAEATFPFSNICSPHRLWASDKNAFPRVHQSSFTHPISLSHLHPYTPSLDFDKLYSFFILYSFTLLLFSSILCVVLLIFVPLLHLMAPTRKREPAMSLAPPDGRRRSLPYPFPLWKPAASSTQTDMLSATFMSFSRPMARDTSHPYQRTPRPRPINLSSSPPVATPSPLPATPITPLFVAPAPLADLLPDLSGREDFMATFLQRHVKMELVGALSATTIGIGDTYSSLLRVLVPQPYDAFGVPAPRSVVPAPAGWLLANAIILGGNAPGACAVTGENLEAHLYVPAEDDAGLPMVSALSAINNLGTSFASRGVWVTSRLNGVPTPRAALVVGASLDLGAMYQRLAAAEAELQYSTVKQLVDVERTIRATEALALAIAHALVLKRASGHGFSVAVVGSRFARVIALSNTVAAVELKSVMPGAAFTVVNVLKNVFSERLYDRLPNNMSTLPDKVVTAVTDRSFQTGDIHYDNGVDLIAMQRFLDLFAVGHSLSQADHDRGPQTITGTLLSSAANHQAPTYTFPPGTPRGDVGAVWALELAHVTLTELPPDLFDRLLREKIPQPTMDLHNLPTPVATAPSSYRHTPLPLPLDTTSPDITVEEVDPGSIRIDLTPDTTCLTLTPPPPSPEAAQQPSNLKVNVVEANVDKSVGLPSPPPTATMAEKPASKKATKAGKPNLTIKIPRKKLQPDSEDREHSSPPVTEGTAQAAKPARKSRKRAPKVTVTPPAPTKPAPVKPASAKQASAPQSEEPEVVVSDYESEEDM